MTIPAIDPIVHAPKRLRALAILDAAKWVDFSFLREQLELTDSDLSKQMSVLCDAGYAKVRKQGHGRSGRTWYACTPAGRAAFAAHVKAIRALIEDVPTIPE